ncbi:hypothetical protein SBOR_7576 [Sclerotinia borealis F-4128]|uniref:Uncharacterized protein n=1 Tax=Sclerotinia borealis (strain F-4128) TaxID=1432307 RepID=W9C866_SCLBF|nr:hypothetical protein SBOR_7576 [Sclerotinia borealis F-4128]
MKKLGLAKDVFIPTADLRLQRGTRTTQHESVPSLESNALPSFDVDRPSDSISDSNSLSNTIPTSVPETAGSSSNTRATPSSYMVNSDEDEASEPSGSSIDTIANAASTLSSLTIDPSLKLEISISVEANIDPSPTSALFRSTASFS